jgi:hypothetical protein
MGRAEVVQFSVGAYFRIEGFYCGGHCAGSVGGEGGRQCW